MRNKKKIMMGILTLSLVSVLAIGGTLAFLTDSEKMTNTFSTGDLDITIDEPNWNDGTPDNPDTPDEDEFVPGDGDNLMPGDTKVKDPTVSAVINNSYMRVIMTVIDNNATIPNPAYINQAQTPDADKTIPNLDFGKAVTDATRLNKNLQTVYFDSSYDVTKNPVTTGLVAGTKYSLATLANYKTINETDFVLDAVKSSSPATVTGVFYYNYNKIFNQGDDVTLFSNVVVPTDWNQRDIAVLGKYKIEVFAQVVQSDNFADSNEAFAALDAEIFAGTVQHDYATVGGK